MPVLQEQKPVIEARRSAGVCSCVSSGVWFFLPFPRFAGVTRARYLLWGANTPWNRNIAFECNYFHFLPNILASRLNGPGP